MRGNAASSIPASPMAAHATIATPRRASQPRSLTLRASAHRPSAQATTAMRAPKVATTAAPVGKSQAKDAHSPSALTIAPTVHPMTSRPATEPDSSAPTAAGTIK